MWLLEDMEIMEGRLKEYHMNPQPDDILMMLTRVSLDTNVLESIWKIIQNR